MIKKRLSFIFFVIAAFIIGPAPACARDAWNQIGNIWRDADRAFNAGDIEQAWKLYAKARKIAEKRKDPIAVAELINSMAAIQLIRGKSKDLIRYRQVADKLKRKKILDASGRGADAVNAQPGNLLVGGGFELGLLPPWGGGHYERAKGKFRFGIWWNSGRARAYMKVDHAVRHTGKRALRITNFSKAKAHVFTTTSQRIGGLRPNTIYRVSMYIKAKDLKPGAVGFAVDAAWTKRLPSLPGGTYDWKPYTATINIGHNDYIDLRILHQNTGTVWLDDITVQPEILAKSSPMQQAEALFDQGQYLKALAHVADYRRKNAKSKGAQIAAHRLGGRIHAILGQYDKALASFNWLIKNGHERAHLDIGNVFSTLAQYDEAISHFLRAAEVVRGDQGSFSLVMERLGRAYTGKARQSIIAPNQRQQIRLAERAFGSALHVLRHIGDLHGEVTALQGLASLKRFSGQYDKARELIDEGIKKLKALDDRKLYSDLLLDRQEALLLSGRVPKKTRQILQALALKEKILDRMGMIRARHLLARFAVKKGKDAEALTHYGKALEDIETIREGLIALPRESRRQFIERFEDIYRGYVETAFRYWQINRDRKPELLDISFQIGQWSAMTSTAGALTQMAARFQSGDDALARLVRERQDLARGIHALNKRLISLFALPNKKRRPKAEKNLRKTLDTALLRLRKVDARLKKSFPEYFNLSTPRPLKIREVQKYLGAHEALVFFLDTPKSISTKGRSYLWMVRGNKTHWIETGLGSGELREKVWALRKGLDQFAENDRGLSSSGSSIRSEGLPFNLEKSHLLYEDLFGQIRHRMADLKQLIIIPSGALTALPFQVLITKKPIIHLPDYAGYAKADWMIRDHALTVLPSVSSFRALRAFSRKGPRSSRPYIGFGNPLLLGPGGNDRSAFARQSCPDQRKRKRSFQMARLNRAPGDISALFRLGLGVSAAIRRQYPLPETTDELCAVASLTHTGDESVYLGANATEAKIKDLSAKGVLGDSRIVHFATHGLLAGETQQLLKTSAEPALLLTPPQKGSRVDDGLLTASEVAQLKLNADWVIMSACNTAAGDQVGAEALSGLARAFFYAGARALLVSHWYVNSDATVELITNAFAALEREPAIGRAEAMRRSMLALIKGAGSNAHPSAWAPFVVVGEGAK